MESAGWHNLCKATKKKKERNINYTAVDQWRSKKKLGGEPELKKKKGMQQQNMAFLFLLVSTDLNRGTNSVALLISISEKKKD